MAEIQGWSGPNIAAAAELLEGERARLESSGKIPEDYEQYCSAIRDTVDMVMGQDSPEAIGAMNEPDALKYLAKLGNELEGIIPYLPSESDECVLAEKYVADIRGRLNFDARIAKEIEAERAAIRRRSGGFTAGTTRV